LRGPVRTNEISNSNFKNLKHNKKLFYLNFHFRSFLFPLSFYNFYCSSKANHFSNRPFYIFYRKLII
jgi:hypothetical protein